MNIIRKTAAAAFAFALAALLCSCEHAEQSSLSTVSTENFAEQGDLSTEESLSTAEQSNLSTEESLSTAEQSNLSTESSEAEFIYAHIGDSVLKILPEQNSSAKAFAELLQTGDLTVEMEDYGGFEKVGSIGTKLPTNDERITAVPGDVILYQGSSVTIYYGGEHLGIYANRARAGLFAGGTEDSPRRRRRDRYIFVEQIKNPLCKMQGGFFGTPDGNRTHAPGSGGRCSIH